ncbi:MAG: hypothetical protein M4D80_11580 [Myxococcota bacterium]|nr:hypothetical protein [Myxococcota bacterium]
MRFVWLVLLAGCWTSSATKPTASPDEAPPQREPFPLHSKWTGVYRCSQGLTAMYLELTAKPDGNVTAIFEFSATAETPTTATGAYRLAGTIRAGREGTFEIKLDPLEWIMAPDGYIMVSLAATSSRKWQRLVGTIKHPACGELDVRRTD